jgi:hypothetical protein
MAAARRGCGLAYVVKQFASGDLNAGSMTSVPDGHSPAREAFYLYHANRAQCSANHEYSSTFSRRSTGHAEVTPMQDLIANFRLKKFPDNLNRPYRTRHKHNAEIMPTEPSVLR